MAALNIDVLAQEAAEGTPQTECMYDCLSGGDRRGGGRGVGVGRQSILELSLGPRFPTRSAKGPKGSNKSRGLQKC